MSEYINITADPSNKRGALCSYKMTYALHKTRELSSTADSPDSLC